MTGFALRFIWMIALFNISNSIPVSQSNHQSIVNKGRRQPGSFSSRIDNTSKLENRSTEVPTHAKIHSDIISIDEFLNYDYDYLNYFYDMDFLDTVPVINNDFSDVSIDDEVQTTKKQSNREQHKSRKFKEFNLFQKKQILQRSTDSELEMSSPNLSQNKPTTSRTTDEKLMSKSTKTSLTTISSTTTVSSNDFLISNTTSVSSSLTDSNDNSTSSGWTSKQSRVSFEVRVEATYPESKQISRKFLTPRKIPDDVLIITDVEQAPPSKHRRDSLTLEVKTLPNTLSLVNNKTISNGNNNAKERFTTTAPSVPETIPPTDEPILVTIEDSTISSVFTDEINSVSTEKSIPISIKGSIPIPNKDSIPVSTESFISVSTKGSISIPNEDSILVTAEDTIFVPVYTVDPILVTTEEPIPIINREVTTISSVYSSMQQPLQTKVSSTKRTRPFAFLRRLRTMGIRTRNIPPLTMKDRKTSPATKLASKMSSRIQKFAKSEPIRNHRRKLSIPNVVTGLSKPKPSPIVNSGTNSIPSSRINLVPLSLRSQLGTNPIGHNPSGFTPFGSNPIGSSPFGLIPQGILPLGISSRSSNATVNSTKTTPVTSETSLSNDTDPTQERYHVQVKKPDGSINGDYIVLDHSTGSLSGVRYEAINGADQGLIQQALLSFLSLDTGQDRGTGKSMNDGTSLVMEPTIEIQPVKTSNVKT